MRGLFFYAIAADIAAARLFTRGHPSDKCQSFSEKLHTPNFFLKIRTHRKTVDFRFRPSHPENMTFRGRNPELESHPEFSGFFLMTRDESLLSLTFSGVCVYLMTKQKPEFDPFPVSGWPGHKVASHRPHPFWGAAGVGGLGLHNTPHSRAICTGIGSALKWFFTSRSNRVQLDHPAHGSPSF